MEGIFLRGHPPIHLQSFANSDFKYASLIPPHSNWNTTGMLHAVQHVIHQPMNGTVSSVVLYSQFVGDKALYAST